MNTVRRPTNFGPVMQFAFVVPDFERALEHWTNVMHVGPFFLMEHIAFAECEYRGKPANIDLTVAIAYWGDMQIEIIHQQDSSPSIYTEFLGRGLSGLQHVGVLTESVDEDLARLAGQGIVPVQQGRTATGIRFAYVSTDYHPGAMVELIGATRGVRDFFEMMRVAARDWDGRDPVRKIG